MNSPTLSLQDPKRRPRRRWLVWGISALLFYSIFGFLVLPLIIRAVAVKQLSGQLDRRVVIRSVRVNPFVLSLTIRGLLVSDKDGAPFLSWDEFYGNFQLSSFFGKAWVFKEVRTSKPFVRVQINKDYSFNFSDLLKKFSKGTPASGPKKPVVLTVERFQIVGARAQLTDLTPAIPFHRIVGPLELTLMHFHTDPNSKNPYAFEGTTDGGEKFSWSGYFFLDPIRSQGEFSLEGISIPKYAPLYQDLVRFEIRDGVVNFQSTYNFALSGSNWFGAISNASFGLKNFKAGETAASNNIVELDSFVVEGLKADAVARTAEVSRLALAGGRITARRERDQGLNLINLSRQPDTATNAPGGILFLLQAATNAFAMLMNTTNLWSGTLHELQVTNCSVSWEDLANRRPVRVNVDEIVLAGRRLSNLPGSSQAGSLSFRWNTNGSVRMEAEVEIAPPSAEMTLAVENVDLQAADPYLEPFLNLFIRDSKVGINGHLRMRTGTNGLPEVSFAGAARLDDFKTVDGVTQDDLLKWKSVQIEGLHANLSPPAVFIKQISLVDPCAQVVIATNNEMNLLVALRPAAAEPATNAVPSKPTIEAQPTSKNSLSARFGGLLRQALESHATTAGASPVPHLEVERVAITNGCIFFNDRSVQPAVNTSVQEINGTILGLSSEELKRAEIQITGKAIRTGPFEIKGKINPLSTNAPTELFVRFSDVDLSPASPYSARFLGYRLNRGVLSLGVNYEVSQHHLKATNLLVLDHFTLGEKVESADATKLPVRLAIALLKDRNGRIELEIPIEGNLDDPEFHFGKVITKVVLNVITKLVTSPFAALGALFGGKGAEVSYVEFLPGRADVTPASEEKLQTLLRGLQERPGLQLEIEGSFEPSADRDGLRHEKLEQQLKRSKWSALRKSEQAHSQAEALSLSPQERQHYLTTLYRAMLKTNNPALATDPNALQAPQPGAATAQSTTPETSGSSITDHGAALLLQGAKPARKMPKPDMLETELLAAMIVGEEDLRGLAGARARAVQQKLIESAKIESERLVVTDPNGSGSTNRASRVFFNLR